MTHDPRPAPDPDATPPDDLQFDRAEPAHSAHPAGAVVGPGLGEPVPVNYATPPGVGVSACAACREPIADVYFEGNGKVVCPRCRDAVVAAQNVAPPATRFFRATLFGIGAGAAGAAIWYGITVAMKGSIYGIVAIVVGLMVGTAVRTGSHQKGGIGYQLLAMAITYLAIAASLGAYAVRELGDRGTHVTSSAAGIIIFAVLVIAGPVLIGFESPLTLIIVGIALWQAWKLNKPGQIRFNGPYRLAPASGASLAPAGPAGRA